MALYDAFVSYSHAKDKPVAAALQSVMQRLGKPWYRRRALRLFRDDTSLSATPGLWPSIEQALANSRFLILLASPQLARSKWCGLEVAYWLEHKSLDTLLVALTEGELAWDDAAGDFRRTETTPLPLSLQSKFRTEPKSIDLRPYRDAPNARDAKFLDAAADLASAVHGVPKEDLLSQEVRQQTRALTLAWSAAAVLLALTGAVAWQWAEAVGQKREAVAQRMIAEQQRAAAEQAEHRAVAERDRAERNLALARSAAEDLVVKIAQGLRDVQGMRVESIRQIFETAQVVMDELVKSAPKDPLLQRTRANMLNEFSLIYLAAGDFDLARRAAEESLAIMRQLLAAEPDDAARQRDVGVVIERLGDVLTVLNETGAALAAYEEGLALARKLAAAARDDRQRQRDLYVSLEKVGVARLAVKDEPGALAAFEEALATIRKLVAAEPENIAWQRDLNVILVKIGDRRLAAGAKEEAATFFEEALQVARRLVASAPANVRWQRDLAVALQRVGDIRFTTDDRTGALAAFEEGLDIARRLVAADPGNTEFRTSLIIMLHRVSTASDRPRAREALLEAIAIVEALERDGKLTAIQQNWPRLLREELAKISAER